DNEEVGSNTANGANSSFLNHILKRVCTQFSASDEDYFQALAHSFAVSADTGHAVHPNYSNMHDPTNRPVLGGGPIIKYSANQRYVTDAKTAALFKNACKKAGVPCQNFVLRSDISGGSTIGPALSAQTSIPTVDVGTAILAMHSIREFASVADNIYTKKAFSAFYNAD
ncbi:MAG: M18 family aminopeptidase, partial [Spirochaetales bacterium]